MSEEFVRVGEFNQFQRACDERHEEVDRVRDAVEKLNTCMTKKFTSLHRWLYLVLGGLIANLVIMLLQAKAG